MRTTMGLQLLELVQPQPQPSRALQDAAGISSGCPRQHVVVPTARKQRVDLSQPRSGLSDAAKDTRQTGGGDRHGTERRNFTHGATA